MHHILTDIANFPTNIFLTFLSNMCLEGNNCANFFGQDRQLFKVKCDILAHSCFGVGVSIKTWCPKL